MKCPHLLDGVHPFCRATRETLVAGLQDLSLCRSGYWVECSAVSFADSVVDVRAASTTADPAEHEPDLDHEAPGTRPPPRRATHAPHPHELPLRVARLLRARVGWV
ncbi:MAG: hypothetical protein U0610_23570 [bacterium]